MSITALIWILFILGIIMAGIPFREWSIGHRLDIDEKISGIIGVIMIIVAVIISLF